jgi:uncharacterized protein DUF6915/uncharacterized protein DUF6878
MTDTPEATSAAPFDDVRARKKEIIFAALADAGIHSVTVDYDGGGDSGQIDGIEAWNAARDKISLPSDRKVQLALGNPDEPFTEVNLEAAIETLAWDFLEEMYAGWEHNDGAFGIFVFDVPNRTVTLEHMPLHNWFDHSKGIAVDFRHRALRHHAEGIFMLETIFGPTITLSTGRVIPTRYVGEQHVQHDLGFIPSFADWMRAIRPLPWMGRAGWLDAVDKN